jgi:hypothetical protein
MSIGLNVAQTQSGQAAGQRPAGFAASHAAAEAADGLIGVLRYRATVLIRVYMQHCLGAVARPIKKILVNPVFEHVPHSFLLLAPRETDSLYIVSTRFFLWKFFCIVPQKIGFVKEQAENK